MNINNGIIAGMGGVLLLLLGTLAILLIINANQRATIAGDDAAKSLLLSQNKIWAEKVSAGNAALAKIKAADAANARAIAKAETEAIANENKLANEAALIAGLKFSGSDCDQVITLGKFYLTNNPIK